MADPSSSPAREIHPIRLYRMRHTLSLQEVAKRAQMSEAGLSRIESGGIELPTAIVIAKLAMACEGEVSEVDIFRYHLAAATGVVARPRIPMTENYTWGWVPRRLPVFRPGPTAPVAA